jgi:hypothetical protein
MTAGRGNKRSRRTQNHAVGCGLAAANWGASIDRAYQADRTNGANLLTITGGHTDALCYCLGVNRR